LIDNEDIKVSLSPESSALLHHQDQSQPPTSQDSKANMKSRKSNPIAINLYAQGSYEKKDEGSQRLEEFALQRERELQGREAYDGKV
jgi:hypothetical protein